MRRLVIFGDSYLDGYRKDGNEISNVNLGYFLSEQLGIEVENHGRRGASNATIYNRFARWIMANQEKLNEVAFLIVWSEMTRSPAIEHTTTEDDERLRNIDDMDYITYMPRGRVEKLMDEDKSWELKNLAYWRLNTEMSTHALRVLCQDYNVPFIMTNSIDNDFIRSKDRLWVNQLIKTNYIHGKLKEHWIEPDKPNNTLIDIIADRWLNEEYDDDTYLVKFKKISEKLLSRSAAEIEEKPYVTDCLHPTEEGCKLIAKTLDPYIRPILEE